MKGIFSRQPFSSSVARISSRLRTSTQSPAFRFRSFGGFELYSAMGWLPFVCPLPMMPKLLSCSSPAPIVAWHASRTKRSGINYRKPESALALVLVRLLRLAVADPLLRRIEAFKPDRGGQIHASSCHDSYLCHTRLVRAFLSGIWHT